MRSSRSTPSRWTAAAGALLFAAACSSDDGACDTRLRETAPPAAATAPAPPPPAAPAEVDVAELASCPSDDRLWQGALDQAAARVDWQSLESALRASLERCPDDWRPLWAFGRFDEATGGPTERVASSYRRALEGAELCDDPIGIAIAATELGALKRRTLQDADAKALFDRALIAAQRAERDDLAGSVYHALAGLYRKEARFAEAIEAMTEASRLWERGGARAQKRLQAIYARAVLLDEVGRFSERLQLIEQGYAEAQAIGDRRFSALFELQRGNYHLLLDETERARAWYAKIDRHNVLAPHALLGTGRAALREGRLAEAAEALDRAATINQSLELARYIDPIRADADRRLGLHDASQRRLRALTTPQDDPDEVVARAHTIFGMSLIDEGEPAEAIEHFRQAVDILDGRGRGLDPTSDGLAYLRERAEPFAELAAALVELDAGAPDDALIDLMARAHARSLREILDARRSGESLRAELARLQAGLGEGELLIDFLIGERRGALVAVTRDGAASHLVPGWDRLREPIARYRAALTRPLRSAEARADPIGDLERDLPSGEQIFRLLLEPIAGQLATAKRLLVVPDRDLALIPLASLPYRDGFLGSDKEIAMLAMAGTPRLETTERTPLLLAGAPVPDAAGEFPALPFAATELDRVAELWPRATTRRICGRELAADRLRELELGQFRTLHFATHAVASSRDPRKCAVILSSGERLGLQEIAELQLGPALVVLSACQTGEGEVIPGEGVVGLSWAFLSAGAQSVVASLWSVEDRSATELMVAFHRALEAGDDPVRALAAAQATVRAHRPHPAYWAPFVVVLAPDSAPNLSAVSTFPVN